MVYNSEGEAEGNSQKKMVKGNNSLIRFKEYQATKGVLWFGAFRTGGNRPIGFLYGGGEVGSKKKKERGHVQKRGAIR